MTSSKLLLQHHPPSHLQCLCWGHFTQQEVISGQLESSSSCDIHFSQGNVHQAQDTQVLHTGGSALPLAFQLSQLRRRCQSAVSTLPGYSSGSPETLAPALLQSHGAKISFSFLQSVPSRNDSP